MSAGIVKLGSTVYFDFTTHDPTTGGVSDADALPTYEVFEDGTDAEILSGNTVSRVAKTGNYYVAVVATAGNGFEVGKSYNVVVSATVNAVAAKGVVGRFFLDEKQITDLNDIAAGAEMDLVDAPNATALTAIGTAVWASASRTLTSFGTLVAGIWAYGTRTLTAILGGGKVCTITVQDGDGNPVGDCPFLVSNSGGQPLQPGTTHSSTGEIELHLDEADDYVVTLGSLVGYSFSNPYDLDVGAAATQAFTLTCALLAAPAAPADPTMCALYAYMYQAETGQTLGAGEGTLDMTDIVARADDDDIVYATSTAAAETDANGLVTVNAPRGATVKLKATWLTNEYKIITVTVPAAANLDVGAYLQP